MLAGTTGLVPWIWEASSWYGFIPSGFVFGGFFFLMWTGELARILFGPQTKRVARTLVVRGAQTIFIATAPGMLGVYGGALFGIDYPYEGLAEQVGTIVLGIGTVVLSIGLILEWKRLPLVVDSSAHKALDMMKESGFGLDDSRLWVGIDPTLDNLGKTYPADDEFAILLHTGSVYGTESGGLYQTMIHEMSHVYLFQKKHPSHIERTFEEVYDPIVERLPAKWQSRTTRAVMLCPLEVFAEDLTFKVLEGSKTSWAKAALEYFRRGRAIRKSLAISSKRRMWGNALLLIRNCYYQSVMQRYRMADSGAIVKKANEKLLASLPPIASTSFDYFHRLFLELRDDITVEDFKKTLEDYLSQFIALAEGRNGEDAGERKLRGAVLEPTNRLES